MTVQKLDTTTISTPDLWSVKDHVAHMTFWRQHLVLKLDASLQHQAQPLSVGTFEERNPVVFAEQQHRPWADIHAESEQAY
ncbi:MAG: hypothetical protein M3Z08_02835 [Chloroflexota bacterium]|nr:hypothetical protein [Chloroflexota bacterium]